MSNVNYSFTENGVVYDFDDVFVPAEIFRRPALWSWGLNSVGQLGINATTNRSTPVTTVLGGTNWEQVSVKINNSAAIKTDGTLWVWGSNINGQLGVNDVVTRSIPVTIFGGGTNWKQVSVGNNHTAAVKTDGTLWLWGLNTNVRLGVNDAVTRSTPVTTILGGTNWKQVSSGNNHTAAVKTDGTLWIWGLNSDGRLGTNDILTKSTPVTTILGGTNWKSVSLANTYSTAIKGDGTLWTWGFNSNGQLGVNDVVTRSIPVTTILGGNNWKSVGCGATSISSIKTDGTLWSWGNSDNGQLGVNDTVTRSTPVTTILGGNNWKSSNYGDSHVITIKTDGTLWIWGNNSQGQLGINATTNRSIPVTTILGGNNWKSGSAGEGHTIAIEYEPDP